ncbi:TPA: hypothetical protein ACSP3M_004019 [Aeromonas veronii]
MNWYEIAGLVILVWSIGAGLNSVSSQLKNTNEHLRNLVGLSSQIRDSLNILEHRVEEIDKNTRFEYNHRHPINEGIEKIRMEIDSATDELRDISRVLRNKNE